MAFLTEAALANIVDLPVALPATEIKQGDWLVVASVKIVEPMRLEYRYATLSLYASSVSLGQIDASNLVLGSLGLVYLALRRDYAGEQPGASSALDIVALTAQGSYARPGNAVILTTPGTYSWIVVNNTRPSNTSAINPAVDITFRVGVTGSARLSFA